MQKFVVVCGFYLIPDNFLKTAIFIDRHKKHVIGYNLMFIARMVFIDLIHLCRVTEEEVASKPNIMLIIFLRIKRKVPPTVSFS